MRWFETNLSNFGRFLDERIESIQDYLGRAQRGPSIRSRIRDARERASERVRDAGEKASESVETLVRNMRSDDRPVPNYIWPMIVLTVVATAGFTYVLTSSFSGPTPTAEEMEMQRTLRKDAARTRSAFEFFTAQPARPEAPSKPVSAGKGK